MKKALALLLVFSILCAQTAFGAETKENEPAISNPDYSYTDAQRIAPFWKQNIMYNETVVFVEDDNGIYGTTLFVPSEILCVVDVTQNQEYYPGVDFNWIEGTNRIEWIEGSSIPYFYKGALLGKASPDSDDFVPSDAGTPDPYYRRLLGGVLYCTGEFLYEKQFCVTYRYDISQVESLDLSYTSPQKDKLKNALKKLSSGEDLKVLFYGDSIFSGCDASSMYSRAPYLPTMSRLIKAELQNHTTGTVTVDNIAVGGWNVNQGLQALSGTVGNYDFSNAYQGYDLMILSFGMNDSRMSAPVFQQAIRQIMDKVRSANPGMEVILVSCMSPNPESTFYGNQKNFPQVLGEIADEDSCTAFVDIFNVHASILEYKDFISTTGNNINHPNDWLIRVYAQNILAAFGIGIEVPAVETDWAWSFSNAFKVITNVFDRYFNGFDFSEGSTILRPMIGRFTELLKSLQFSAFRMR